MPSTDSQLDVASNVPLAPFTTLGIGGAARWFVRATDPTDVAAACAWASARSAPILVLGGGSNLVISDAGVDGLVLQIGITGISVAQDRSDTLLTACAGEPWDAFVADTVDRGLAGIECLSGIPGTVGGTPIQNVGAYGQEVGHVIETVTAFDRRQQSLVRLTAAECAFAYRMSRFKREDLDRFVVCDVTFRLRAGSPTTAYPDVVQQLEREHLSAPSIADVRRAVIAIRRRKGMVLDPADPDTRSVGSFFMNPIVPTSTLQSIEDADPGARVPRYVMQNGEVKIPAAWLIERSGFAKGHVDGAVGLSTRHPLAIVNRGGATARDVLQFAGRITRAVHDRFGVTLRPEPVFVGFADESDIDFLAG